MFQLLEELGNSVLQNTNDPTSTLPSSSHVSSSSSLDVATVSNTSTHCIAHLPFYPVCSSGSVAMVTVAKQASASRHSGSVGHPSYSL